MPATALPPAGGAPEPAKTCDASGMAMIHRYFRAGFAEMPALIASMTPGDDAQTEAIRAELSTLIAGMHSHHDGEDERLWPALEQRAPGCAAHVERMKQEHEVILAALQHLETALPAWRTSNTATDAAPVIAALEEVNAAMAAHFPDEEQNIVPVMETTLTPREIDWFSQHGRASMPKGQTWNSLGAILAAQPDRGTQFLHELPPPVRLLWRWVGARKYAQHRATIAGH